MVLFLFFLAKLECKSSQGELQFCFTKMLFAASRMNIPIERESHSRAGAAFFFRSSEEVCTYIEGSCGCVFCGYPFWGLVSVKRKPNVTHSPNLKQRSNTLSNETRQQEHQGTPPHAQSLRCGSWSHADCSCVVSRFPLKQRHLRLVPMRYKVTTELAITF